jgi:hypothetical protein
MESQAKLKRKNSDFSGRKTATTGVDSPLFAKKTARKRKSMTSLGHLQSLIKSPKKGEIQMTTDVAAQVVKQYLLPMFEQKTRSSGSFDTDDNHKPLEALENTVYGELKAAEQLSNELAESK